MKYKDWQNDEQTQRKDTRHPSL